jgi:hypothetical protein
LRLGAVGLIALIFISTACNNSPAGWFQLNLPGSESPLATPTPLALPPRLVAQGLSQLRSYRTNLIVEFNGVRNGQPVAGRAESLTEVTRWPEGLHQYLKVQTSLTDTARLPGAWEFYRVGDKVYVRQGDQGEWFSFSGSPASPEQLGFLALERLITLPAKLSQAPQPEILNGQKVQRFSFTAADLAAPNLTFTAAEGEVWLPASASYVAQYVISATLRVVIPEPTAHLIDQGQLKLRYTVSAVNEDFTIQPPAQALTQSNRLGQLPHLPDATIRSIFPSFIEYTSAISPISATMFYQAELPKLGWSEAVSSTQVFKEKARLTFAKADEILTVLITPSEERDKIKVLLELK